MELEDDIDKELEWLELTINFTNENNSNKRSLDKINEMSINIFTIVAHGIAFKKKYNNYLIDTSADGTSSYVQST